MGENGAYVAVLIMPTVPRVPVPVLAYACFGAYNEHNDGLRKASFLFLYTYNFRYEMH